MRPGIVLVSNYVVGGGRKYSGIIDYYERYENKNEKGNPFQYESLKSIREAENLNDLKFADHEKEILKDYESYVERGGHKDFIGYVKGEDKESEVSYGNYINYMNKSMKSSGLFGDTSDHFSLDEKETMKELFNKGQENGSVLWGNVYSFDNDFLKEHRLMDEETGHVNEIKIKQAVRESMRVMMDEEKIDLTAVWCGEIHYDTDNIHVHTSVVEMKNTRPMVEVEKRNKLSSKYYERTGEYEMQPKAKLKQKTLDNMKSTFANKLIDRTQDLKLISDLRMKLHHSIEIDEDDLQQKKLLNHIKDSLPEQKKDWQYNNKKMENVRPLIDRYTENHLNKYHRHDYDEFRALIKKEQEWHKEIYGEGSQERYKDYEKNKMIELKSKMGNELLKEMKSNERSITYSSGDRNTGNDRALEKSNGRKNLISREKYQSNYNGQKGQSKVRFIQPVNMYKVNKAIKTTFRTEKRNHELELEHQQMQKNIQRELNRQEYER